MSAYRWHRTLRIDAPDRRTGARDMARRAPRQWFERDDGFTPRPADREQRQERRSVAHGGPQAWPIRWRDDEGDYAPQWYAAAHNANRLRESSKRLARANERQLDTVGMRAVRRAVMG